MIVTEFEIDHFRGRNSLRFLDLGNGLNVALVGNHTDKTAMLSVVPYVLYGTVADDARKWADSIDTDAGLVVQTDNGVFRIDRRVDDSNEILIRSPDGMAAEPEYLDTLVDGVGPRTFFCTFTLNSRGLRRRLDRRRRHVADETQRIAEFLRDASPRPETEVPHVTLKPLRELDSCVAQLRKAIGSQAAVERDRLKRLAELPTRDQLNDELKRIEHELTDVQAKEQRAHRELEDTRLAITFHQLRVRLTAIENDLTKLREAPTKNKRAQDVNVPSNSLAANSADTLNDITTSVEVVRINERLLRCHERLEQLREQQRESRELLADDDRVVRMRRRVPRIEAVLLQEKFVATEEQSIEQLADTIRDLEARIESDRLAAEARAAELATDSELAAQSLGDIDRLGAIVKEAKRIYRSNQQRTTKAAQGGLAKTTSSLSTTIVPKRNRPASSASKAVQDAERTVKRLRQRIGVENTISNLSAEYGELENQLRRLYGQHLPPLPILMMLGIPFALGAAMILNGFYRYEQANLQLMGLGALILIVTSLIKLGTDNVNGDQLFHIRNQLTELGDELDDAKSFREQFDRDWPDMRRPWLDQLQYAEQQFEVLCGDLDVSASRKQYRSASVTADAPSAQSDSVDARLQRRRHAEARQRYRDAMARWEALLSHIGLPVDLSPTQARLAVEQKVVEAQSASHFPSSAIEFQLRHLRNDLERRRSSLAEILGQSRQLVQELGYSLNGTTAGEQMEILRESLQEHQETENDFSERDSRLINLRFREEKLQRYNSQLTADLHSLHEEFDKRLDAEKVKQQMRAERAKLLERERDQLLQQIAGISLRDADDATVSALSELTTDQLQARIDDTRTHWQELQSVVVGLVDRRARVHERLKQHDDIDKLISRDGNWNDLLATTQDFSQRWQTASREQQNQTKQLASHLKQAETYKYLQLAADNCSLLADFPVDLSFDESGGLRLLNKSGKWHTLRRLNQHRLSQLYISLWLARIQEFADRGVKMPVIIDDILSLAPRGRERLAMLLREFAARGHQLLLITSNEKHADVFADLEVPIADLADRETVVARDEDQISSLTN